MEKRKNAETLYPGTKGFLAGQIHPRIARVRFAAAPERLSHAPDCQQASFAALDCTPLFIFRFKTIKLYFLRPSGYRQARYRKQFHSRCHFPAIRIYLTQFQCPYCRD